MKFSIDKTLLLENLLYVIKAISPKNIIPILNGIKFELNEKGLELTASDSELTVKTLIPRENIKNIEQEGIAVIQSKYIIDIVRKMPSDIINVELLEDLKIKIYTDKNKYNLNCLNVLEYPKIDIELAENPINIKGNTLKQIIKQTSFAVSTQESRPILTGVNFHIIGNIFECIVTDSYRLAKKTININETVTEDINIVIPGKNLIEFDKVISDDSNVAMHIFNNKIVFVYKNIIFQSNLLNGTYPDTTNLIPKDFKFILKLNLKDYYDSVDRASLLTQTKDKNTIKMFTTNNLLTVSSLSTELGKVEEYINIEKNIDEDIEISYSSKYMMEALRTFEEEEILILLNSDVKPIIIKNINDDNLIQLILPIKTY